MLADGEMTHDEAVAELKRAKAFNQHIENELLIRTADALLECQTKLGRLSDEWAIGCPLCNERLVGDKMTAETIAYELLRADAKPFQHRFTICSGQWELQRRKVGEWQKV